MGRPSLASLDPRAPRVLCPSPARAPMALTSISSTLMCPPTRHLSGATREATPSTTGRSTSHRRTTHFKAKLKWNDGYAGRGEHYFDYNHGDNGYKAPVHHAP